MHWGRVDEVDDFDEIRGIIQGRARILNPDDLFERNMRMIGGLAGINDPINIHHDFLMDRHLDPFLN